MSKINIRSPYFISVTTTNVTSAVLDLYIYTGTQVATITTPTYSLDVDAYKGRVDFEISQLIADYLDVSFDGVLDSQVVWVNYQVTEYISEVAQTPNAIVQTVAFDGYGNFEDGINPQLSDRLLQSNTTEYVYDANYFYIPIQQDDLTQVDLKYQGSVIDTETFTATTDSADVIRYVAYTNPSVCTGTVNYLFEDRADYLFEDSNVFVFSNTAMIDEILITYSDASTQSISIETIEEAKYTPYRITFVNKFGVLQSVWMFKRSDLTMQIESEKYRSYTLENGTYSTAKHQYRNLMVSGKQAISLNSGFYPETYNIVFEQLVLSEKVWIDYEGNLLPVNLKSNELAYKTRLNDKLINYKLDFEFAFDKINSIY